jgi:hypothetical protein
VLVPERAGVIAEQARVAIAAGDADLLLDGLLRCQLHGRKNGFIVSTGKSRSAFFYRMFVIPFFPNKITGFQIFNNKLR